MTKTLYTLHLEDGTSFLGKNFGSLKKVCGEVVFNTAMSGYVETLTDPSYRGQILVLTYPLIGNYGVPPTRAPNSLDRPFESNQIQIQGLITQHYQSHYSHHNATRSLGDWLQSENVPGITGIDTRHLTQILREKGTMKGWICPSGSVPAAALEEAASVDMVEEVFNLVAPDAPHHYPGSGPKILVVDIGAKDNIFRSLTERGADVLRLPWHSDLISFANRVDGVLIGNGPGDPKNLEAFIKQLRALLTNYQRPIFGICMGVQLLALAAGGNTYKLPYGHRGINQPVQDLLSRRCYITSQNHGYAVDADSLPTEWEPWFVNINDGSCEGIRSQIKPYYGVQFHPEASPGPEDTNYLFDEFLHKVSVSTRERESVRHLPT